MQLEYQPWCNLQTENKIMGRTIQFFSVDGDTAVIQMPTGRKLFRTNVVKPFHGTEPWSEEGNFIFNPAEDTQDQSEYAFQTSVVQPSAKHDFVEARKK